MRARWSWAILAFVVGCNPPAEREPRPASAPTPFDPPGLDPPALDLPGTSLGASPSAAASLSQPSAAQPSATVGDAALPSVSPPGPPAEELPAVRRPVAERRDRSTSGRERMEAAERTKGALVRELFASAGLGFPPRQLLFRAFKKEGLLQVWAADSGSGPLRHVTSYQICYASGDLGPKRREGDLQVPEGFYKLTWLNAKSAFHMAMLVGYPNGSDRVLSHPTEPGGEIMIHGSCVSVGCLAMSDDRIEELWVMVQAAPRMVPVHIFPSRDMRGLIQSGAYPQHQSFWQNLEEGFDRFERTHTLFEPRVARDGRYLLP